jgi:hypothetical protein
MGILDDAIREHLDLKRRLGAEADELARLEGEAFGPPSRPGDPDFPEQPPTGENAVAEQTAEPVELASDMPAPAPEEPVAEAPPETAETAQPTFEEPASEELALEEPPADDDLPEAAVPLARELRAIVDPPAEESPLREVRPEDELDLDLDLDLDEPEPPAAVEPDPTPPPAHDTDEQPAAAEEPAAAQPIPGDTPIEGLDTVEHPFEGAIEDTGEVELVEGEIAEEPRVAKEHDDDEEEGEDVLEETPEFLREKPEDDELWFEQGEPKDFDF